MTSQYFMSDKLVNQMFRPFTLSIIYILTIDVNIGQTVKEVLNMELRFQRFTSKAIRTTYIVSKTFELRNQLLTLSLARRTETLLADILKVHSLLPSKVLTSSGIKTNSEVFAISV